MTQLHVLIAIGSIQEGTGGTAHMLAGFVRQLSTLLRVTVVTQHLPGMGGRVSLSPAVEVQEFRVGRPRRYGPCAAAREFMERAAADAAVVHSFGLWRAVNRYAARAARAAGAPLVVSTQGMLEANALRRTALPKRIAWALWERRNALGAACLHATSELERQSVRRLLADDRPPIAVIPNGVDVPLASEVATRDELARSWPALGAVDYLLFLGRVHAFKRPLDLLEAWATSEAGAALHLVFAGPSWGGQQQELEAAARRLGVAGRVLFTGTVSGRVKGGLLTHARALVLPSESENFGNVVVEALACGTPAIANRNAPWQVLDEVGCGWWIDPGLPALRRALDQVAATPPGEAAAMGERGRALAQARFAWPVVSARMAELYRWVATGGAPPACLGGGRHV